MSEKAAIRSNLPLKLAGSFQWFWGSVLMYLLLSFILRILEVTLVYIEHVLDFPAISIAIPSFFIDLSWQLYFLGLVFVTFLIIQFFAERVAKGLVLLLFPLLLIIQGVLLFYFKTTLVPLGKDLFAYSYDDMLLTIEASGQFNLLNGFLLVGFLSGLIWLINFGGRRFALSPKFLLVMSSGLFIGLIFRLLIIDLLPEEQDVIKRNVQLNKVEFLAQASIDHFLYPSEFYFDFYLRSVNEDLFVKKEYTDNRYPFSYSAEFPDVLSPFFDSLESKPDIVFVLIESMGKAYSGNGAYLGSFTPFLDSLEQHSLVWNNAISSTGRTFGILPGILSGLPFGERGFLSLHEEYPRHNSLISQLKKNGYESYYFIGADRNFDDQGSFLEYHGVDHLNDISTFDPKYPKSPEVNGFSWGYADKELVRDALDKLPLEPEKPQLRIVQTQTSHDPYIVPERGFYEKKLMVHLRDSLGFDQDKIEDYMVYEDIYMTLLYADDAVREFITEYKKRPNYENTIFIFTGDHRLPEIPMSDLLDRFHVPLLMFSPKINRPTIFRGMTSHFDVTPSLLAFLQGQGFIEMEKKATWMGQVLDTAETFQAKLAIPLMRNKNQIVGYVRSEYFLTDGRLRIISDDLKLDPVEDVTVTTQLQGEFEEFKNKNNYMVRTRRLLSPYN